ncbi:hypothetical protein AB0M79_25560 [Polymorphospora sp. NPDC051019]|uniref:hypothetical protein n=1 Tax=Polymorphospora sp. NPDC051019 TaxID=3155725 RepID=UPI00341E5F9A
MRIEYVGEVRELVGDERVTFGRSRNSGILLDPDDVSISRTAGTVHRQNGVWWLTNSSDTRTLSVVDDVGFRQVLPPARRVAVETPTMVLVDGARGQHLLRLLPAAAERAEETDATARPAAAEVATAIGADVLIKDADRLAMVALFAGYLREPPRYDPHPQSYGAAAKRLGWPESTLRKRIEYLRTRLDAAGVPNLHGSFALANLAEYAIGRGLVTREDLALLPR